jgi:hypothetical protein
MSVAEDPGDREHIGDEYVTYNRRKEGRPRPDFPPFPPSLEEEEEAQREAERRVEHEAKRMLGDRYERPEGSGKAPMDPEAAFMQVLGDLIVSQQAMTQYLAQMADRLAIVGTLGTQAPHAAQGNSRAGSRPHSPTRTYTSSSRIPKPLFPQFPEGTPSSSTTTNSTEVGHSGGGHCRLQEGVCSIGS